MHVIFIPYSLMKVDPASWMKMATKFKGNNLQVEILFKSERFCLELKIVINVIIFYEKLWFMIKGHI